MIPDERRRGELRRVYAAAIEAVHGESVLRACSALEGGVWRFQRDRRCAAIDLPRPMGASAGRAGTAGRLRVIGAGKAAASLARGVERSLAGWLDDGLVVVKHGHRESLDRIQLLEGGHPLPDAASVRAAQHLLGFVGQPRAEDRFLVLLTGGASSVLAAPAPGLTLEDKIGVTGLLLAAGAPIDQINIVRRHLSSIKGGQLARRLLPAQFLAIAISDVPDDDPAVIGSGPTLADPSSYADALSVIRRHGCEPGLPPRVARHLAAGVAGQLPETPKPGSLPGADQSFVVIATLDDALGAAAAAAQALGWSVESLGRCLQGNAHERAREFAGRLLALRHSRPAGSAPHLLLAGGEPTLAVRGAGLGGRNQEFALVLARELSGSVGVTALVAGTDGTDGPTPHAGGYADGASWQRAALAGVDPAAGLADNDSSRVLGAAGDLFDTGPTGTNVADLVFGVVG